MRTPAHLCEDDTIHISSRGHRLTYRFLSVAPPLLSLSGKSYFGAYLLLRYAKSGKAIVYEDNLRSLRWLLGVDHHVRQGNLDAFMEHLDCNETTYICDVGGIGTERNAPYPGAARTIVLSSRDPMHYAAWLKRVGGGTVTILSMPEWSAEEMAALAPRIEKDRRCPSGESILPVS
jgi:hypothetical protein